MRNALLLSFILLTALALAETTIAQQKPRATTASGRSGMALVVTDRSGKTLGGVQVTLDGPSERSGTTNPSGQLSFTGLQAGTYRLRFEGEEVTAFEKEVTLRAGQTATIDVALHPAPPPREIIKEAPAPPAPAAGPAGEPRTLSIVEFLEENIDRKQPRRETLISCSGNTRTTLVQLNGDQPERLYDSADSVLYVVAGEGTVQMTGRATSLEAGSFISVPRNTSYSLARRGRNPLIVLSILSGPPCEEPR